MKISFIIIGLLKIVYWSYRVWWELYNFYIVLVIFYLVIDGEKYIFLVIIIYLYNKEEEDLYF